LINEFPRLRLLIAPRHPERASQIEGLIKKFGFTPVRISRLNLSTNLPTNTVFILDTIGQLVSFYAIADIVFVGGSFIKKGGQNILEPAFFSKAIIFGPYMFNFRQISKLYLERQAARMVPGKEELFREIKSLLSNPGQLKSMGSRAKQLISENQGATVRNVQELSLFISHG